MYLLQGDIRDKTTTFCKDCGGIRTIELFPNEPWTDSITLYHSSHGYPCGRKDRFIEIPRFCVCLPDLLTNEEKEESPTL